MNRFVLAPGFRRSIVREQAAGFRQKLDKRIQVRGRTFYKKLKKIATCPQNHIDKWPAPMYNKPMCGKKTTVNANLSPRRQDLRENA